MRANSKPFYRACLREEGNVAIEFALIGLLLMMLTLGAFELGRFAYSYHRLETAVGATTRLIQMQAADDVIEDMIMSHFSADEQAAIQVSVPIVNINGSSYRRVEAQYALQSVVPNLNLMPDSLYTIQVSQLVPIN